MSDSEYGTSWPPEPTESTKSDLELERSEDSASDAPAPYEPKHLAEYKVSETRNGGLRVRLRTPALEGLYAVPGERIRVFDHPAGVLITHADLDPEYAPEALPVGDPTEGPEEESRPTNKDTLSRLSILRGDGFIADDDAQESFYNDDPAPAGEFWPPESSTNDVEETDDSEDSDDSEETEGTDYTEYVHYSCRHCDEECINKIESDPARMKQCRDCFTEESLHILDPITHHLPEEV